MLKAHFYNRTTSLAKEVELDFFEDLLRFEFIDPHGYSRHLSWKSSEIHHEQQPAGNHRKIVFLADPSIFLELSNQDFSELDEWMGSNPAKQEQKRLLVRSSIAVTILLVFLSIVPLFYFFGLPLLADFAADRIPVDYERQMGQGMSANLLKQHREDKLKSDQVQEFVTCFTEEFKIPIKVHVIHGDELNAFAVPGGTIFIYTKMLDACQTPEELAALLGHEIGHAQLRHTIRSVMRSIMGSALLSLVVSDYGSISELAVERAAQLKDLSYSRSLESEADVYSIRLLGKSGVDPNGIIRLFQVFKKEEDKAGVSIPAFLSSHPLTEDRMQEAKAEISQSHFTIKANEKMKSTFQSLKGVAPSW